MLFNIFNYIKSGYYNYYNIINLSYKPKILKLLTFTAFFSSLIRTTATVLFTRDVQIKCFWPQSQSESFNTGYLPIKSDTYIFT